MTCTLHAAAMRLDDVLPSMADSTWQRDGTVSVPIGLMLDLREALRGPMVERESPSLAAFEWDDDLRETVPVRGLDT